MIQYNQYDEYAGDIGMLKNSNIFSFLPKDYF